MIMFAEIDATQRELKKHIMATEVLIARVCSHIGAGEASCQIITLEDLGFSNNVMRMMGGFFTGMYISWKCDIPFIPVDATVNSCGVSIYRVREKLSFQQFCTALSHAEQRFCIENFDCNYHVGNHFISFCEDKENHEYYLVIHSSDSLYKYGDKGLYPREDTWYYDKIEVYRDSKNGRYIRYITGDTARRFYSFYIESEKHNPYRNDHIAETMLSGFDYQPYLYTQHYGMPSPSSIAIGCQWDGPQYVLLTAEGKDIYLISSKNTSEDYAKNIFPHGFGVELADSSGNCKIQYKETSLIVNENTYNFLNHFLQSNTVRTRFSDRHITKEFIHDYLNRRNVTILKEISQLYSYSRNGIKSFI